MQKIKVFFYVSLGILALAVAFQLGAQSAQGQSATKLVDIEWRVADGRAYAVDSQGGVYSGPGYCGPLVRVATLPGNSPPVGILGGDVGGSMDFFCENGDAYTIGGSFPNISFSYCINVFGNPVPTIPTTWGRIKAERR
jgi:hypothetical protein